MWTRIATQPSSLFPFLCRERHGSARVPVEGEGGWRRRRNRGEARRRRRAVESLGAAPKATLCKRSASARGASRSAPRERPPAPLPSSASAAPSSAPTLALPELPMRARSRYLTEPHAPLRNHSPMATCNASLSSSTLTPTSALSKGSLFVASQSPPSLTVARACTALALSASPSTTEGSATYPSLEHATLCTLLQAISPMSLCAWRCPDCLSAR